MEQVIKFNFDSFSTALAFLTAEELRWLLWALSEYAEEGTEWEVQYDEKNYDEKEIESYRKVRLAFYFMKEHVEITKSQQ